MKSFFTLSALSLGLLPFFVHAQTGNVGIGTTNPQAKLHTVGSVRHDTLAGTGNRIVFANAAGDLFAPSPNFFASTGASQAIPDNGCNAAIPAGVTSTITVSGLPTPVASANIKVRLNITHTFATDIVAYLQAPNGNVLRLSGSSSVAGQNFTNTILSDAGLFNISQVGPPFNGHFRPDGTTSLSCGITPNVTSFAAIGNGMIVPDGTWTLRLFDKYPTDAGSLSEWAISFDGSDPVASTALTPNVVPKSSGGGLVNGTIYDAGGAIGIGTSTPHAPLQFSNTTNNKKLVLFEQGNNAVQFAGLGTYGSSLGYQLPNVSADHIFLSALSSANNLELMRIKGSGKVGIGTSAPNAPLQFSNNAEFRKIVLYEHADNEHQFLGFGTGAGILRYQIPGSTDAHVFYAGNGNSASTELMRIKGDGTVGIGTTTPGFNAKVEIVGHINKVLANYQYYSVNGSGFSPNGGLQSYSLYTSARIWCGAEINVTSDERTKTAIAASSPASDLALVNRLRVVDYNYTDAVAKGSTRVKGFLAQEVEQVMPEAVSRNRGVVPDIYRKAVSSQHNAEAATLTVAMNEPHKLSIGDEVKLITDGEEKLVPVVAVGSDLQFTVGEWSAPAPWVFVYGREVDDLRNLDYNKIFSAGISAIQELNREVDALKKTNSGLQQDVQELRAQVQDIIKAIAPGTARR
jgi:subtilisin-like proprotein convertase family protein